MDDKNKNTIIDKPVIIRTKDIRSLVNNNISKNDNESIVKVNNDIKNTLNPIFHMYVNFYDLINPNNPDTDRDQPEYELFVDYKHYPIFKYTQRITRIGPREGICINKLKTCMLHFSNLGANEIKFYIFYKTEADNSRRLSIKQIDLFRRFNTLISKIDLVSNYTIVDVKEYKFNRGHGNW